MWTQWSSTCWKPLETRTRWQLRLCLVRLHLNMHATLNGCVCRLGCTACCVGTKVHPARGCVFHRMRFTARCRPGTKSIKRGVDAVTLAARQRALAAASRLVKVTCVAFSPTHSHAPAAGVGDGATDAPQQLLAIGCDDGAIALYAVPSEAEVVRRTAAEQVRTRKWGVVCMSCG